MAWFKFGKKDSAVQTGRSRAQPPVESVEAMRQKAKFRLIGSAVLVLAGVVGFPILFDSQPRTVAVDIPIDIPDKNKVAPLAPSNAPSAAATGAVVEDKASLSGKEEIVASSKPADKPLAAASVAKPVPPKPAPVAAATGAAAVAAAAATAGIASGNEGAAEAARAKAAEQAAEKAAAKIKADKAKADKASAEKTKAKLAADAEAARAKALLDGSAAKPAAAAAAATSSITPSATDAGRFIVQFGAFSDAAKAQEVRQQVEKTGLKTYSQVAKTADGDRIRVRVGPFTSRAEADKAAAKIKALNLPASVLTL